MNLKLSTLLCAIVAAQLHAATPEAAINAARMPEADVVLNIRAAKIHASEFAKPAFEFFDKLKPLIARNDKEAKEVVARFDAFLDACKAEKISLADIRTVSFAYDTDDGDMPPFAFHFENPLTMESFRKCATAFVAWFEDGLDDAELESVEKGVAWTDWCEDRFLAILLGDDNNIVYLGAEETVKPAMERLEAGTRVEFQPAMKALLDETLTRRDAYFAMSNSEELRDLFEDIVFDELDFDEDTPVGKKMQAAIKALDGFTVGVDSTGKLSVTANLMFSAPEHAAFAGEFLSAVGLGAIKAGLFTFTGAAMPVMDSLKISTQEKTVIMTGEVVAKDLEILLAGIEKMFPPPKAERRPTWE